MGTVLQDVRFALRTLKSGWLVTGVAILSLAVAIGGNAAVFSLIDAFLFRPQPYEETDRLVLFGEREKDESTLSASLTTSLPTYADLARRSRTVTRWAAVQPRTLSLRGSERAEAVSGMAVTGGFFDLLGIGPVRGRAFGEPELTEGGPRVVVLSDAFRERRFAPDEEPLGAVLTLDGEPHEVVGVLPPEFSFLMAGQDLWVPLTRNPASVPRDRRDVLVVGRMGADATMDAVRAEMVSLAERLETEHPAFQRGWTVDSYNLRYDIPDRRSRFLFGLLQGSVLLVLVIACVNISNLLLARSRGRAREIALRTALGAGRGRIARQLLTESAIMVTAGGTLGVVVAAWGIRAMADRFVGSLPATYQPALDHRVLLFTAVVAVTTGLVFGMVPTVEAFRSNLLDSLKEGGERTGSGGGRKRLTRTLVVAEIALSFVALGGGSVLVRSFLELRGTDPGFETSNLLTARVTVPASRVEGDEERVAFQERVLERAAGLAGVRAVALVNTLPQGFLPPTDTFRVAGAAAEAGVPAPEAVTLRTSPGYLETLGIDLLQGRFFEAGDRPGAAAVAVVSRSLARNRFPGGALGRRLEMDGGSYEIVGVVEDVVQTFVRSSGASPGETVYRPAARSAEAPSQLVLRTSGDPRRVAEQLRTTLQEIDPDLTVSQVLTMDEYVARFFVGIGLFNVVLTGFGLVALLLASLGTYGVLAYAVSQRRHEIGIRMAVGAGAREVVGHFARQGMALAAVGLAIGVLLTLPVVRLMRSLLEGFSTVEPGTLVGVAAVLFVVTAAAGLVPAARAAAVDPVRTLRND